MWSGMRSVGNRTIPSGKSPISDTVEGYAR
jgi:hypothetical protein